ncbi:MAG: formate dehydrogenase, partial [Candidatus Eiseniibacteriota bacterium]
MTQVSTSCARDCYDTCSLVVTLGESGEVLSVRGDPQHPMTRGITCPRAARDHERLLKNRIDAPFLRAGGNLKRVRWERSLDVVSQKLSDVLERHGPEAVLYLDYA